jgi:hypothetical protein
MATATATAIFNTNIETPAPNARPNSYDLDTVITKEGFEYENFSYRLGELYTGVSLVDNELSIDENAYGEISVTVSAGDSKFTSTQATATTKLYGFYAARLELINNQKTLTALQNAIKNAQKAWPSLVGVGERTR